MTEWQISQDLVHNERAVWLSAADTRCALYRLLEQQGRVFSNSPTHSFVLDPCMGVLVVRWTWTKAAFSADVSSIPFIQYALPCRHTLNVLPAGIRIPREDLRSVPVIRAWTLAVRQRRALFAEAVGSQLAALVAEYDANFLDGG